MKLNVIVIDDSPVQLLIMTRLVQRNKHLNLIGAYNNPQLGLGAVNSMQVDLVFLDVEMPEMDGFSLLKRLRKKVEVIMNSTKEAFKFQAYNAGAADFLNKPISASRLDSTISRLLEGERAIAFQQIAYGALAS